LGEYEENAMADRGKERSPGDWHGPHRQITKQMLDDAPWYARVALYTPAAGVGAGIVFALLLLTGLDGKEKLWCLVPVVLGFVALLVPHWKPLRLDASLWRASSGEADMLPSQPPGSQAAGTL
jgi:hypothetical protein